MTFRRFLGRWWREPLVHFVAIGALLFGVFSWRGGGSSRRIVITPGQVEGLVTTFARTWQRSPSPTELKNLVDDYVREEIAMREAIAMGLDRDDINIRRRLRLKFEYLAEEAIEPPTDTQLQAWLEAHRVAFRSEPEVSFRQVYLNPRRRGAAVDADARRTLARLSAGGPSVALDGIGDPSMVPADVGRSSWTDIAKQFGAGFADALWKAELNRWSGPVRSGVGLHLVHVRERANGRDRSLAEVRAQVEREFLIDQKERAMRAMYARLLARYTVVLERPATAPATQQAATAAGSPASGGSK